MNVKPRSVFALPAVALCRATLPAQMPPTVEEARDFLNRVNAALLATINESSCMAWAGRTYINGDTEILTATARSIAQTNQFIAECFDKLQLPPIWRVESCFFGQTREPLPRTHGSGLRPGFPGVGSLRPWRSLTFLLRYVRTAVSAELEYFQPLLRLDKAAKCLEYSQAGLADRCCRKIAQEFGCLKFGQLSEAADCWTTVRVRSARRTQSCVWPTASGSPTSILRNRS